MFEVSAACSSFPLKTRSLRQLNWQRNWIHPFGHHDQSVECSKTGGEHYGMFFFIFLLYESTLLTNLFIFCLPYPNERSSRKEKSCTGFSCEMRKKLTNNFFLLNIYLPAVSVYLSETTLFNFSIWIYSLFNKSSTIWNGWMDGKNVCFFSKPNRNTINGNRKIGLNIETNNNVYG